MTIDCDVTRIFSGLRRRQTAEPPAAQKVTKRKHRNSVRTLVTLLGIYVGTLLLIYAAVGAGTTDADGNGLAVFFSHGYEVKAEAPEDPASAETEAPQNDEAAMKLTETYNRTVEDAARAYIDRIEEDVAAAEKIKSGEVPVFLTEDRVLPVYGEITSGFCERKNPFYTQENGEEPYEFHKGVDIAADTGTPVYAYTDGIVIDSSASDSYGNYILVSHGGYDTLYAHLYSMTVKEGDQLKAGDKIAFSGNTGRSTAPHLHFEVRGNGEAVDPLRYLT